MFIQSESTVYKTKGNIKIFHYSTKMFRTKTLN